MIWWGDVGMRPSDLCGTLCDVFRHRTQKAARLERDVLSFVPVAVLTAIIVPSVMIGMDGAPQLAGNPRLPAALFAIIVAWFLRSVLATIAGGLVSMWCLNWIGY